MPTTVTRKVSPMQAKLRAALVGLDVTEAKVGWFSSDKYEATGTPVAYVAAIQEFGYAPHGLPPRLGFREMCVAKRESWMRVAAQAARNILNGKMDVNQGLELIGAVAEGDGRKQIASVDSPSLAESTLVARANKLREGDTLTVSGAKPLVDTGLMLATLTHIVSNKTESDSQIDATS